MDKSAIDYLAEMRRLYELIKLKEESYAALRSGAIYRSPQTDSSGGGGYSTDKLGINVARLAELEQELRDLKNNYDEHWIVVEKAISQLDNVKEQRVLAKRYLYRHSWDPTYATVYDKSTGIPSTKKVPAIYEELGLSRDYVFALHRSGMRNLCKIMSKSNDFVNSSK